jgi:hypothetical protein
VTGLKHAFDGAAREQKQRRRLTYKIRVILAKHDAKIEPRARARFLRFSRADADKFRRTHTQTHAKSQPLFRPPSHIIQFACNSYRKMYVHRLITKSISSIVVIDFAWCQRRNLCFRPWRKFARSFSHGWIK